jgi:hypothetical protein
MMDGWVPPVKEGIEAVLEEGFGNRQANVMVPVAISKRSESCEEEEEEGMAW